LPRLAGKMAIINNQPTDYDHRSEVVIREDISQVLRDLVKVMENKTRML